ncbi:MAG: methyltransferase family protein [Methylomonas sp.]
MLFTLLVPGTVILYIPYSLVSGGPDKLIQPTNLFLVIPAGICMLIGTAIYLRCAWDFAVEGLGTPAPIDPPKNLVVAGLYRRTRNPMYQGVILLLLGECLWLSDTALLIYALSIAAAFHTFVVLHEEPALRNRFGDSYTDYCNKVPRWGFASRPFSQGCA